MKTNNKWIVSVCIVSLLSVAATVVKISEFPNTATLGNNDLFVVASGATNKNIKYSDLVSQLNTNLSTSGGSQLWTNDLNFITIIHTNSIFLRDDGSILLGPNIRDMWDITDSRKLSLYLGDFWELSGRTNIVLDLSLWANSDFARGTDINMEVSDTDAKANGILYSSGVDEWLANSQSGRAVMEVESVDFSGKSVQVGMYATSLLTSNRSGSFQITENDTRRIHLSPSVTFNDARYYFDTSYPMSYNGLIAKWCNLGTPIATLSSNGVWVANGYVGDGSGLTNLDINVGNTNSTPPGDTTTIKAWVNVTLTNGSVWKMPLYQ